MKSTEIFPGELGSRLCEEVTRVPCGFFAENLLSLYLDGCSSVKGRNVTQRSDYVYVYLVVEEDHKNEPVWGRRIWNPMCGSPSVATSPVCLTNSVPTNILSRLPGRCRQL